MTHRGLRNVRRRVRSMQAKDRRGLQGAIVGRALTLPHEDIVNGELPRATLSTVQYHQMGQVAAVYLYRKELAEHRGKTFFNQAQVRQAIDAAPPTVRQQVVIGRRALELINQPFATSRDGREYYWLLARAGRAHPATDSTAHLNLRHEETAIARHLFAEGADVREQPYLWLGALSAEDFRSAEAALDPLEALLGQSVVAGSVNLIPYKPIVSAALGG